MGLGKTKSFQRMPDNEAIELGGEMLGESIIFGLACLVVVAEYMRGARKEAVKEEAIKSEKELVTIKLEELFTITEIQKTQIRDLQKSIDDLMAEKKKIPATSFKQRILG